MVKAVIKGSGRRTSTTVLQTYCYKANATRLVIGGKDNKYTSVCYEGWNVPLKLGYGEALSYKPPCHPESPDPPRTKGPTRENESNKEQRG